MGGAVGQRHDERRAPDELFRILAEPRRRATLRILASADGSLPLADVVERLAGAEETGEPDGVRTSLHHGHLPKMEEAGFVAVRGAAVELTERGARAEAARRAANGAF